MECPKCRGYLSKYVKECPDCGYTANPTMSHKAKNVPRPKEQNGACKKCGAPGRLIEKTNGRLIESYYLCYECNCRAIEDARLTKGCQTPKYPQQYIDYINARHQYYLKPLFYGKNPEKEQGYEIYKKAENAWVMFEIGNARK